MTKHPSKQSKQSKPAPDAQRTRAPAAKVPPALPPGKHAGDEALPGDGLDAVAVIKA